MHDDPSNLGHASLSTHLRQAGELIQDFYDGLDNRRVGSGRPLDELVDAFRGTLGEEGVGLEQALRDVEETVLPDAMGIPHPLYLGLINSSPLPGGIVAESLVGALNNNAGAWEQSPPLSAAEHEVERCFIELLGLDPDCSGIVLPGGSYATLHALQLAREAKLPEWRRRGARALSGDPRVYVSDSSHFSAVRAAVCVGVAPDDVVRVTSTGRGAMDPAALREALTEDREAGKLPFAVVATLGTTGTGAIDPLPGIVEVAREFDLWVHVDACYGGAAALVDGVGAKFADLRMADSVAVDPHKWFFVPIAAGLLFTPHRQVELDAFDVDASYIPRGERTDAFRRGFPTSRRAAGFTVWMALRAHGLGAIRTEVARNIRLTRALESALESRGFEVMPGGALSIACARWAPEGMGPDALNDLQGEISRGAVDAGKSWFGTVHAQGKSWMRFTLVSTFTRQRHIDLFAEHLLIVAQAAAGQRAASARDSGG